MFFSTWFVCKSNKHVLPAVCYSYFCISFYHFKTPKGQIKLCLRFIITAKHVLNTRLSSKAQNRHMRPSADRRFNVQNIYRKKIYIHRQNIQEVTFMMHRSKMKDQVLVIKTNGKYYLTGREKRCYGYR